MAIYHLSTKPISRSKGRSATASSAYRSATEIKDERTGLTHDYTKKQGVTHTEIITPNDIEISRSELWNLAEKTDTRKNSRTAREIIINLPHELNQDERKELVKDFAHSLVDKYQIAVDVAIHEPDKRGDNRNHHAHLMLSTRNIEMKDGTVDLTAKSQLEMSDTQLKAKDLPRAKDELKLIRGSWADLANQQLEKANIHERIDHRSNKDQGIDMQPTKKMGWQATDMERKGIQTEKGDINRAINADNAELNSAMKDVAMIKDTISEFDSYKEQAQAMQEINNEFAEYKRQMKAQAEAEAEKAHQAQQHSNDNDRGFEL